MPNPVEAPAEAKPVARGPAPRRSGRRQRRLRWTLAVSLAASALWTIAGVWAYRASRPDLYKPGEEIEGITRELERGGEDAAAPVESKRGDAPAARFTDVTKEAGLGDFRTFAGNRTSQLPEDMGSGAAWGDYDNDGDDDLFLVSAGGPLTAAEVELAPSLLYENLGNGKFRQSLGLEPLRIRGMGAAWSDYDADGFLDLAVSGYDKLLLFRNEKGTFARVQGFRSPKGFWTGISWGDYDNDGYPDLYVCGYVRYMQEAEKSTAVSRQFGLEVPYTLNPSSYEPERNLLFHNNGRGAFTEVAAKLGVDNPTGRSLSGLWHDFDGNGWLDLYVANDISESKLYLNRGGKFVNAWQAAWVGEYRGSMGLATGDFDRDGDDDLFISHWIAQQYALYQSLLNDQKLLKETPGGKGDSVSGGLHFMDVAEVKGIGQPTLRSIGWGTEFADFDADGWLDLVVANGSTFETPEQPRRLLAMPAFLFRSEQGRFFRDIAPSIPALAQPHASRGLAVADYDNDGAADILIVDHDAGVRLLRNGMQTGNWLELRLRNRAGERREPLGFGEGAVAIAEAGGMKLRRAVASASYLSQSSRRLHLGLGDQAAVDRLEVRWPGGTSDVYSRLEANTVWEVTEGDPVPRRLPSAAGAASAARKPTREQLVQFWNKQRGAMDALKFQHDTGKAAGLFREALALDPAHEDSRYYLAHCLAAKGDVRGALAELEELARINSHSHRAFQRSGVLIAATASGRADYELAEKWLQRALSLNPEETGSLLILGEIALVKGDAKTAQQRLDLACRTNPRAVGGFFLRGYLAWKRGEKGAARELLKTAQAARGKDWKPRGTVAEGDVLAKMHSESTLLSAVWDTWDGGPDPVKAYRPLESFLKRRVGKSGDLPRVGASR